MDAQPVPELTAPPVVSRGVALASTGDRLYDDLAFAAQIGLTHVRLDARWSAAQPKAGAFAGGVIEDVVAAGMEARRLGLAPWFRLMQADTPRWFDDEGGLRDDKATGMWWPRWVEHIAEALGDVAAGWVPFEAPFAMVQRVAPDDPRKQGEVFHTLVVAWRDAWRILRGGPPVSTSLDVAVERPMGPTQADLDEARRREQLRWGLWLDGLAHGIVRIPGRGERELPDLAGACDVVGLAVRSGVGAALHRAADQGPERPLAVTFRPKGTTDSECADSITTMWRDVREVSSGVEVAAVTATPFLDDTSHPARLGLATGTRRLKDAGEAFLQPL